VDLAPRVLAFIRRHGLLEPGDRVLVAVSGGADSLALLHILHELSPRLSLSLIVAHLEHGLRGADGPADAGVVEAEAARLGLPFMMERARIAELAAAAGLSLETAGRTARYDFFRRAAREAACRRVATGHTADDSVETLVFHILRGAGLDGLRGIPKERELDREVRLTSDGEPGIRVVRPLLQVTRAETVAYCAARGLTPREDVTNRDLAFARNRLRHRLLPELEAEAPPGLRRRLIAMAAEIEEEVALLEGEAAALLASATRERGTDGLHLDATRLAAAAPALARRALRRAVRWLSPECELDRAASETLLRLALGDLPTGVTLPGGRLRAVRRGDSLWLVCDYDEREVQASDVPLPVPGSAVLRPWRVTARLTAPPAVPGGDPRAWVLLDAAKVCGPLCLRYPRAGDRVRPLGMQGRRKLQDLFVDARVPRHARSRVPVVVDAERILWVIGFCISEDVRLDSSTVQALRLEAGQEDADAVGGG
jgi:tRNA(Ile)-lysidine synthase